MILQRLVRRNRRNRKTRSSQKRQRLSKMVSRTRTLESLEDRRVLAAGIVDLPATGGEFLLTRDTEDVIVIADPISNPVEIFRESFESLDSLQVNGSDADDQLRVDLENEAPVPAGGLTFSGGDQTSLTGDALVLEGGSFSQANFTYLNANDGSIAVDGSIIDYTGLEPISSSINAANVTLNYLGVSETITVSPSGNQTTVDSTIGEVTTFNNPTDSLTITSDNGSDLINIQGVGTGFDADVSILAGTDDTIDLQSAIDIGTGVLHTIAQTINSPSGVATSLVTADSFLIEGQLEVGGSAAGLLPVTADTTFEADSIFAPQINSEIAGLGYDQLAVTGTVTIDIDSELTFVGPMDGTIGGSFVIIDNDGTDPVSGTFAAMPEGTEIPDFLGIGRSGFLTYTGGDGNDVAIDVAHPNVYVDVNGNLVIDDPLGDRDDNISIAVDGDNYRISDPQNELVAGPGATQNGNQSVLVPSAGVTGDIIATTQAGADNLTVDFEGGTFANSILFDGGAPATGAGDALALVNGQATTVTHTFINASDGTVAVDDVLITYTGLEPVIDNLSAVNRVFTFTGGAETITLADDATPNDNVSQIDSTLAESVTFVHPTNSLTINAGSGEDLIDIDMVDAMYAASLIVNGGAGDDVLDIDDLSIVNSPGRGLEINSTEVVTINDSTFSNNTATDGAGLLIIGPSSAVIDNSDFLNNAATGNGGGINSNLTTLTLQNGSLVSGNTAGTDGGGIWSNQTLVITASTITANTASGPAANQGGGGIFNAGGTVIIDTGTSITTNIADGASGSGGGIFNDTAGTVSVANSMVTGNRANRAGGGIEARPGTTTTLINVNLDTNNAGIAPAVGNPGNGGGLHITGNGNATIIDGTVHDNVAASEGGGLWNGSGTLTVNGATILRNIASGNAADNGGGGIFNDAGVLDIDNLTFEDNEADGTSGSGGAIFSLAGTITIDNSTIRSNTANRAGGGIEIVAGTLTLNGTDLLNNDTDGAGATAIAPNPGNGGGIHVTGAASVNLNGGDVMGNIARSEGGGLWNSATGTMTIISTTIDTNTARSAGAAADAQGGGGIFNDGGMVSITGNVAITNNIALDPDGAATSDDGGGGIFNSGGSITIGNPASTIVITGNTATDGSGNGGAILTLGGDVTIGGDAVTISNNQAARAGGGIENNNGMVTLNDVTVENNTASINGGGLHATGAASVTIVNDGIFRTNTAQQEGGGLWNGGGLMQINRTAITANTANSAANAGNDQGGGGVFNIGGTLNIDAATITDNIATANNGNGGGVMTVGGTVTIDGGSISGNDAARAGGGIENNAGNVTVTSVTVENNTAAVNGGGLHASGAHTTNVIAGMFQNNTAGEEGGGLWSATGTLIINGTTITANTANSANNAGNDQGGGGVFNIGGTLDIDDATITNNLATANNGNGGGVMTVGGTAMINGGRIADNQAARAGGGIENNAGNLSVTGVTVENNTAGVNGGGLHASGASTTTVTNGEFRNNTAAQEGGGLWNGSGMMTINGTLITANAANSGANAGNDQGGGGVFNVNGTLDIDAATITANIATANNGNGGGVMTVGGTVTIDDGTISDNDAARAGGGIENNGGNVTVTNVTVRDNSAGINGGGLHASGAASLTDVIGGLFQNNTATQEGGGLWNGAGAMTVTGTTVSANTASGNPSDQGGGGLFNAGGMLNISGATVDANIADGTAGSGGGILNDATGTLTIIGTSITNNRANRAGGGVEATAGTTTILNNVILDSNNAGLAPATANPGNGGGLHITGSGNAMITGGTVNSNTAAREGGGLWNGSGLLTVNGTTIARNVATGNASHDGAGGIFNDSGVLDVDNATIELNEASGTSGSGGGILSLAGTITIDNSSIESNSANRAGGGIEIVDGTMTLTSTDVRTNDVNGAGLFATAPNPGNGGGIHITDAANVTLTGGSINGNSAALEGGGLWTGQQGTFVVVGTTINDNTAGTTGGGIENLAGTVTLTNATVNNNTAGTNGGGLHAIGDTSMTMVTGGQIQDNVAGQEGGGLWNGTGALTVIGTTISRNTASGNAADQGGGGIFNAGGTLNVSGGAVINLNLANGTSGSGGGIFNDAMGTLTVTNSAITGNVANRAGGGIEATAGTTNTLTNVMLNSNSAGVTAPAVANPGNGGGMHITGAGGATITGGTINGNTAAAEGGGLWNGAGTMMVSGTTIDGNTAFGTAMDQGGGGAFNSSGVLMMDNVVLNNNVANSGLGSGGGAMNDQGTMDVTNSTLTNNDFCALTYIRPSGTITGNVFAGNVGGNLCPLWGTSGPDTILITSTLIMINADELNYDGAVGPITIDSKEDEDVFNVQSTAAANPITIFAGADNDVINVSSDAPANTGNLDDILGDINVSGQDNSATGTHPGISAKGTTIGDGLVTGDVLNVSDNGSNGANTYVLDATTFARTAAIATGTINYDTIETLDITTGVGADNVTVTDTAPITTTSLNTNVGDDTVAIDDTGDNSVLRVETSIGDDTITLTGGGTDAAIELRSSAGDDRFDIVSTGGLGLLVVVGGDGDDTFGILTTSAATTTQVFADSEAASAGDGSDTIGLGQRLADVGDRTVGDVSGLDGAICVDGGAAANPLPMMSTVEARRAATGSVENVQVTADLSDLLFYSDASSLIGGSYTLTDTTVVSNIAGATVTYDAVESVQIVTSAAADIVAIVSTGDGSTVIVETNDGDDIVTVSDTGNDSVTMITTGLITTGDNSDQDNVTIETTGDQSIVKVNTDAGFDGGVLPVGASDSDTITVEATGTAAGVEITTGDDADTINIGLDVGAGGIPTLTGNRSLITASAGAGEDTFEIHEVFVETVVDLRGDDDNDTFNVRAEGSTATGNLTRINDGVSATNGDDDVAQSRELLLDGGDNGVESRDIIEGVDVTAVTLLASEGMVAGQQIGDIVTVFADSATGPLDLRYVITQLGHSILATTTPVAVGADRSTIGNEAVETANIERFTVNTGSGDDILTLSSEVPLGIESTGQIVRFDGGTGDTDRFEVSGGDGDDRITIGPISTDAAPGEPIEIADVEYVRVDGRGGDDQVSNRTDVISVLNGGAGNDDMLGGSMSDTLSGGAGVDHIYGLDGNDILMSDQDFGSDVVILDAADNPVGGELLDGGNQDNLTPGDICVQFGVDLVRNCEALVDGGAEKDVLTWLRAILVSADSILFDPLAPQFDPFLPIFNPSADSNALSVSEPSTFGPAVALAVAGPGGEQGGGVGEGEMALDVNRDGVVSARDALNVINALGRLGNSEGESGAQSSDRANEDVNADGQVSALDALVIINSLGRQPIAESAAWSDAVDDAFQQDDLDEAGYGIDALLMELMSKPALF